MRRSHGHLIFGCVAGTLVALVAVQSARLHHARVVNAAIAQWSRPPTSAPMPAGTGDANPPAAAPTASANASDASGRPAEPSPRAAPVAPPPLGLIPEARLARAVALSPVDYDGALAAYKLIIQAGRPDLQRIALYDLGNLHLHQALRIGLSDETESLPLVELAKQSYREVLRRDPSDWDARYNLERALRLSPEEDEDEDVDTGPPDPREHERSTIADPRMDLP